RLALHRGEALLVRCALPRGLHLGGRKQAKGLRRQLSAVLSTRDLLQKASLPGPADDRLNARGSVVELLGERLAPSGLPIELQVSLAQASEPFVVLSCGAVHYFVEPIKRVWVERLQGRG